MGILTQPVRVLLVEDDPGDAELTLAELRRAGISVVSHRVHTAEDLEKALDDEAGWDVVVSDFSMPGFGGLEALDLVVKRQMDVPFLFVSGVIGEERAVEAMRAGARDYVLKDNLARLGVAIARELTEAEGRRSRKRAERALADQERKYRSIFETLAVALLETDISALPAVIDALRPAFETTGLVPYVREHPGVLERLSSAARITDANEETVRLLEAGSTEQLRGSLLKFSDTDQQSLLLALADALAAGRTHVQQELEMRTLKGQRRQVLLTARISPVPSDLKHLVLSVVDLTERRRLEDQIRGAQRMEAVGRLAGGIAHDFNNLLTVIDNYTALLISQLPEDSRLTEEAGVIREASQRAATLTRQLLTFSRRETRRSVVVDVNEILMGLERILRRFVDEDVDLVVDLSARVPPVEADPSQLEQVVLNLVVNAKDAIAGAGTVTVRTQEETARDPHGGGTRTYVRLTVVDDGSGMDEATRARIFEPFFTTKAPGKGTGLGLATVYGIVQQSGGFVEVDSGVGRGTRFDVYLPASPKAKGTPARRAIPASARKGETVLLVEDQDLVRRTTYRILESAGYAVLAAASGDEAIDVASRFEGAIDCIVTDVVMPGMSVLDAIGRLRELHPEARIVFTSGYAGDILEGRGVLTDEVDYLAKPYTSEALLAKVRDVIDGRQRS